MSDQNEGGSSSSSSSAKEIAATVGVGVVQTAMFIYDFLTFPIYYAAQRPWKAVEAGARIRADIVARLGFGPEIFQLVSPSRCQEESIPLTKAKALIPVDFSSESELTLRPRYKTCDELEQFKAAGIDTMDKCWKVRQRENSCT